MDVGDKFPRASLPDHDGNTVNIQDISGDYVVLYFYPKDDTPGCTKQACNIRDNYSALTDRNITIYGVSGDGEDSHNKFIEKYDLPFPLLIDKDHKLARKISVYGEKNMYGKIIMGIKRMTYILKDGVVVAIIKRPDVSNHVEQILKKIDSL